MVFSTYCVLNPIGVDEGDENAFKYSLTATQSFQFPSFFLSKVMLHTDRKSSNEYKIILFKYGKWKQNPTSKCTSYQNMYSMFLGIFFKRQNQQMILLLSQNSRSNSIIKYQNKNYSKL